jgi:hypothetical protein
MENIFFGTHRKNCIFTTRIRQQGSAPVPTKSNITYLLFAVLF